MQTAIVAVGKLKNAFWKEAALEFEKRIGHYLPISCVEVADEAAPERLSPSEKQLVMEKEGARILAKLHPRDFIVALTPGGKSYTSEGFSAALYNWMGGGHGRIVFLIGGSLGLAESCLRQSHHTLSLSSMTFPHALARVVLLEQLYRACKIANNETYHK